MAKARLVLGSSALPVLSGYINIPTFAHQPIQDKIEIESRGFSNLGDIKVDQATGKLMMPGTNPKFNPTPKQIGKTSDYKLVFLFDRVGDDMELVYTFAGVEDTKLERLKRKVRKLWQVESAAASNGTRPSCKEG